MNEGKYQLKWSVKCELHMTFFEAWIGAVWGLCWCNFILLVLDGIYIILYLDL